ncbi:MAG: hypothetical protein COB22_00015 [Cycloclasticus sp.]|nr:MAG: hypothetical protein COB22_00015 [Cycloclasticus sp.]
MLSISIRSHIKFTPILVLVFLAFIVTACNYNKAPEGPYLAPQLSINDIKLIKVVGDLPTPPAEYEWTVYKGIAFLKPTFWREYKNNKIYITSPVPLTQTAQYATGISVRTIENIRIQNNIDAQTATMKLINIINKKITTKKLEFTKDFSKPIKVVRYRYLDTSNPKDAFIKHMHFLINNEESYIHIFDYKSPANNWDYQWKNRALLIFNNLNPVDIF